mgnify:CR=1 FL=1
MNKLRECKAGEQFRIQYINGTEEQKRRLQNLGFIPTSIISVINTSEDNMIVQVFQSRVAINYEISDLVCGIIIKQEKEPFKILSLFKRKN